MIELIAALILTSAIGYMAYRIVRLESTVIEASSLLESLTEFIKVESNKAGEIAYLRTLADGLRKENLAIKNPVAFNKINKPVSIVPEKRASVVAYGTMGESWEFEEMS